MYARPVFAAAVLMATPVAVKAPTDSPATAKQEERKCPMRRPSELPIYSTFSVEKKKTCHDNTGAAAVIESSVRVVRIEVSKGVSALADQKDKVKELYATGVGHTQGTIEYLHQPSNTMPRIGAVGVGAAAGFILGLRHGAIRRFLYTLIVGGGVASVCYPEEADKYSQLALIEGKKYAKIGYNFAYGVKPGEDAPPLPSSFKEIGAKVSDYVKNTYEGLSGKK